MTTGKTNSTIPSLRTCEFTTIDRGVSFFDSNATTVVGEKKITIRQTCGSGRAQRSRVGVKKTHPKQSAACMLAPTLKPRCFLKAPRQLPTPLSATVARKRLTSRFRETHFKMTAAVGPIVPLSWWFLSGCTGRGLDTRLGLLLTLLALTEFIWVSGDLEGKKRRSLHSRSGESKGIVYVFFSSRVARSAMF